MANVAVKISPQAGPQMMFASCPADIAFFGGHAGGGKTFSLVSDPLHFINEPGFAGVIFRRQATQVRNKGGLWDESRSLYGPIGAVPNKSMLEWSYRDAWFMKFCHLENDDAVYEHQGAQYAYIGFDELTHFSEFQFFYMLSRLRSVCGVNPYARGTCNPDADSWVRKFIGWWIDPDTGYAIPERSGVIRWFVRRDSETIWGDSKEELESVYGENEAMSFTFIMSKLEDNKILMQKDPRYTAKLNAQDRVERARLKDGNWNVRYSAGSLFRQEWFEVIDAIPSGWKKVVRFWDRAATKPHPENSDPDWTRGLKLYAYPNNTYVVADLRSTRDTPLNVEQLILNTASYDGRSVKIMSQQDPGSAGVLEASAFTRMLAGYWVETVVINKKKLDRAKPVSAQCEAGNVKVLRGPWNEAFFGELESFPDGPHDDIVDVLSGAFNDCAGQISVFDAL